MRSWRREWDRITIDLTNSIRCRKPLWQVSLGCFLDHSQSGVRLVLPPRVTRPPPMEERSAGKLANRGP